MKKRAWFNLALILFMIISIRYLTGCSGSAGVAYGAFRGRVEDTTGQSLSGVRIRCELKSNSGYSSQPESFIRYTTTHVDGTFVVDNLIPGNYTLGLAVEDYTRVSVLGVSVETIPEDYIHVQSGAVYELPPIIIAKSTGSVPGSLDGIVRNFYDEDIVDGTGLTPTVVTLVGTSTYTTTCDQTGYFKFSNISPGSYTLSASRPNYHTTSFNQTPTDVPPGNDPAGGSQILIVSGNSVYRTLRIIPRSIQLQYRIEDSDTAWPLVGTSEMANGGADPWGVIEITIDRYRPVAFSPTGVESTIWVPINKNGNYTFQMSHSTTPNKFTLLNGAFQCNDSELVAGKIYQNSAQNAFQLQAGLCTVNITFALDTINDGGNDPVNFTIVDDTGRYWTHSATATAGTTTFNDPDLNNCQTYISPLRTFNLYGANAINVGTFLLPDYLSPDQTANIVLLNSPVSYTWTIVND